MNVDLVYMHMLLVPIYTSGLDLNTSLATQFISIAIIIVSLVGRARDKSRMMRACEPHHTLHHHGTHVQRLKLNPSLAHALEGYSTWFVCVFVCVCLSCY